MASTIFSYTGAAQAFVVPAQCTSVTVEAWGAKGGGSSAHPEYGGLGGYMKATQTVTPGETLQINVGGAGTFSSSSSAAAGGFNGGAAGGANSNGSAGSGGGATDVRRGGTALANRIVVGGGGGGFGASDNGGSGGGTTGASGGNGFAVGTPPTGGTQSAGGAAGMGSGATSGSAGTLGIGGAGADGSVTTFNAGGGGGGGYYGGGGGAGNVSFGGPNSSGAGGSSYASGSIVANTQGVQGGDGQVTLTYNVAPNAPTLTTPTTGATIAGDINETFAWTFSDPDAGDTQSAFDFQYRLVGAGSWTQILATVSPTSSLVIVASTLANGSYEWQVRTYDAAGAVGPWSTSSMFTAVSTPATPTITSPTSMATIATTTASLTFTSATHTKYRVRKVNDDGAGHPVVSQTLYDSGAVTDATSPKTAAVPVVVGDGNVHLQVAVFESGVWSLFADVEVTVSLTAPAMPTLVVTPSNLTGAITVAITNPSPTGSEPTVTSVDVYRRETLVGGSGIRVAAALSPGVDYIDRTPASGVDYSYLAVATATDGAFSSSAWTA